MKVHHQPIPLRNAIDDDRMVKSISLVIFRGLRSVIDTVAEIPGVAKQAASDIAEAWEESSSPNA